MARIRSEVNSDWSHFQGAENEDVFGSLYLTERHGCIPDHLLGDEILVDIHNLFYCVFDGLREELAERIATKEPIFIAVDPAYEDNTLVVMCTYEKVLHLYWSKAWNFYWDDESEMAEELGRLYEGAEQRLAAPGRESEHEP